MIPLNAARETVFVMAALTGLRLVSLAKHMETIRPRAEPQTWLFRTSSRNERLNALVYGLYGLSAEEIEMVER